MATFRVGFKIFSEISKKQGRHELSHLRSYSEDRYTEVWKPEDQWSPKLPSSTCNEPKPAKSWTSIFRSRKAAPCDYRRSNCPPPAPEKPEPWFSFTKKEKPPSFMCRMERERQKNEAEENPPTCENIEEEKKWPEPPKEKYRKEEPKPAPTSPHLEPKENELRKCPYQVTVDHPWSKVCVDERLPYEEFRPQRTIKTPFFSLKDKCCSTATQIPHIKNVGRVPFSEYKNIDLPRPLYTRYKTVELEDSNRLFSMAQLKCPTLNVEKAPSLALQPPPKRSETKVTPKQPMAAPSYSKNIKVTRLKNAPPPEPFTPKPTKLVEKPKYKNPCADSKRCSLAGAIHIIPKEHTQLRFKRTTTPSRVLTGTLTDEPLYFERFSPSTKPPDWMFRLSKTGKNDTPLVPCLDPHPKEPDWCGETDGLKFYDATGNTKPEPCNKKIANEPIKPARAPCVAPPPKKDVLERFVIMPERFKIRLSRSVECKPDAGGEKMCFQDYIVEQSKKMQMCEPCIPRKEPILYDIERCSSCPNLSKKCIAPPPPPPPCAPTASRSFSSSSKQRLQPLENIFNRSTRTQPDVFLCPKKGDVVISSLQNQLREQSCGGGRKSPNPGNLPPCRRPQPKPPKPPKCENKMKKRPNCAEVVLPCCPPATIPPDCDIIKQRVPCKKVLAPRPAYSECRKDPPPPPRITECNCWDEDPVCPDEKPSGPALPRCSSGSRKYSVWAGKSQFPSTEEEDSLLEDSSLPFRFNQNRFAALDSNVKPFKSRSIVVPPAQCNKKTAPWPSYSDVLKRSLQDNLPARRSVSNQTIRWYSKKSKYDGAKSCNRDKCQKKKQDDICNLKIDKGPMKTWDDCPEPCDDECPPPCEIIEPVDLPGCQDPCKEKEEKRNPCEKKDPCSGKGKKASGLSYETNKNEIFYDATCEDKCKPPPPPPPPKPPKKPKKERVCPSDACVKKDKKKKKPKEVKKCGFGPDVDMKRINPLMFNTPLNRTSNAYEQTVNIRRGMASCFDKGKTEDRCKKIDICKPKQPKKDNCDRIALPCCKPPKLPPLCVDKVREACKKTQAPSPSYSECKEPDPKPPITECTSKLAYLQPRSCCPNAPEIIISPPKVNLKVDPSIKEICEKEVELCTKLTNIRSVLPEIPDPGPQPELGCKPPTMEMPQCFSAPPQKKDLKAKCDKIPFRCKSKGRCPEPEIEECPKSFWQCLVAWCRRKCGKGRSKSTPRKTSKTALATSGITRSISAEALNVTSTAAVTAESDCKAISAAASASANMRPPPPSMIKITEGEGDICQGKRCVQTLLHVPKEPCPRPPICPAEEDKCKEHPWCPKIRLPCCDPARCPPTCDAIRVKVPCRKIEAPVPAFSECQRDEIPKLKLTECTIQDRKKEIKIDTRMPAEPFMPVTNLPPNLKYRGVVREAVVAAEVKPYESEIVKLPPRKGVEGDCRAKESDLCNEDKFRCDNKRECGLAMVKCPEPPPVELPKCIPYEEEVARGCSDPCIDKSQTILCPPPPKGPCDKNGPPRTKKEEKKSECKKLPSCKKANPAQNSGKKLAAGFTRPTITDPLFGNSETVRCLSHSSLFSNILDIRSLTCIDNSGSRKNKYELPHFQYSNSADESDSSNQKKNQGNVKKDGTSPLIDDIVKKFDTRKPVRSDFTVPRTKMPPPTGVIPTFPEPRSFSSRKYEISSYMNESVTKRDVNNMSKKLELKKTVQEIANKQSQRYSTTELYKRLGKSVEPKSVAKYRQQHEDFKRAVPSVNVSFRRKSAVIRKRYASSLAHWAKINLSTLPTTSMKSCERTAIRLKSDYKGNSQVGSSETTSKNRSDAAEAEENEAEIKEEEAEDNENIDISVAELASKEKTDEDLKFDSPVFDSPPLTNVAKSNAQNKNQKKNSLDMLKKRKQQLETDIALLENSREATKKNKVKQEKLLAEIRALNSASENSAKKCPSAIYQTTDGRIIGDNSSSKHIPLKAKDWKKIPGCEGDECIKETKKQKQKPKKKVNICDIVPRLSDEPSKKKVGEKNVCDDAKPNKDSCKKKGPPCDKKKCDNPLIIPKVCFSTGCKRKSPSETSTSRSTGKSQDKKETKTDPHSSENDHKRWQVKKPGPNCNR